MASRADEQKPSNPTSALLQDMLREKKAQSQRVGSRNGVDDRNIQSSPLGAKSMRNGSSGQGRRGSAAFPREMGMREMEDHASKMNKQNFDLKLEVFHLRQRNEVLEGKVDSLHALETDNEEMQALNEDLLLELEKRDIAIKETVALICELEAKIEDMADAEAYFAGRSKTSGPGETPPRDTSSISDPVTSMTKQTEAPALTSGPGPTDRVSPADGVQRQASPPRQDTLSPPIPSKSPRRVPSFILDAKKSTNVLRSLYSANGSQSHGNPSFTSLARPDSVLSGDEDDYDWANQQMLNSPRLSVLSESGFSSIYNFKDHDLTPGSLEGSQAQSPKSPANSPPNQQREVRLQKWVEERNLPETPPRGLPKASSNDHFGSIGQVLDKVPSVPKDPQPPQSPRQTKAREQQTPKKHAPNEIQAHQRRTSSPAFGGPIFGTGYLPPTPDTMSTRTGAANSSTPSIITEKSLFDRPLTSGSGSFQSHLTSALDTNGRNACESSDDGQALPRQRGSNPSLKGEATNHPQGSPRTGGFNDATRRLRANAPGPRPSLTTSATATGAATIFSSQAYMPSQASRTLSYPSPTGSTRRPTNQLSPTSSATRTPTKRSPIGRSHRSPKDTQDRSTSTALNSRKEAPPQLGRSASLRSRMAAKMTKTPNQTTHQSVASRLFRRTTTQHTQIPPDAQVAKSSRPAVSRAPSNQARVPRPSSPHNARPVTANSEQNIGGQSFLPTNTRRHSAILDGGMWGKEDRSADESKRWSVGLGASASAKLREGFGFKRSLSTQGV